MWRFLAFILNVAKGTRNTCDIYIDISIASQVQGIFLSNNITIEYNMVGAPWTVSMLVVWIPKLIRKKMKWDLI